MIRAERGSTVPLILGFFLLALLASAAAVTAGQAFVAQRDLQDQCDGLAAAAAAATADLDRTVSVGRGGSLRFGDVRQFLDMSVSTGRADPHLVVAPRVTDGGKIIRLRCTETVPVAFGALFGRPDGLHHVVDSSAQEPVSR